jgi:hypothetical protein
MTFYDAATPLTNRILSPIYAVLMVLMITLTARLLTLAERNRLVIIVVLVLTLSLISSFSVQSLSLWEDFSGEGRRLTSQLWRGSETIKVLRGLDVDAVVYTNEPQPVRLHTGIAAFRAPEQWDSIEGRVPDNYQDWLDEMRIALKKPNSALVLFHPSELREETAPFEVLTEGLILFRETEDAVIYGSETNRDNWLE